MHGPLRLKAGAQSGGEAMGERRQQQVRLEQRKVVADADAGTGGERVVGVAVSRGLLLTRPAVGVVTNVDPEMHLGEFYMDSAEKIWNVFRTQVDLVLSYGVAVLNAEDPAVVEMAPLSDGEVIFYGVDGNAEAIATARSEGKRTVYVKDGAIVLATGDNEEQLARLARIAMLADGAAEQPGVLSNLLGAVAGAWALGVAPDLIRAGVKPYNPSAPLRAD